MRVHQQSRVDAVVRAVDNLRTAEAALRQVRERHQLELADAEREVVRARARVEQLVGGDTTQGEVESQKLTREDFPDYFGPPQARKTNDAEIPKCWRVAFRLLRDPIVDYQAMARELWPNERLDRKTAKNRVNAQLTRLRRDLQVIQRTGSNRYEVNRAKLEELAPCPIPVSAEVEP